MCIYFEFESNDLSWSDSWGTIEFTRFLYASNTYSEQIVCGHEILDAGAIAQGTVVIFSGVAVPLAGIQRHGWDPVVQSRAWHVFHALSVLAHAQLYRGQGKLLSLFYILAAIVMSRKHLKFTPLLETNEAILVILDSSAGRSRRPWNDGSWKFSHLLVSYAIVSDHRKLLEPGLPVSPIFQAEFFVVKDSHLLRGCRSQLLSQSQWHLYDLEVKARSSSKDTVLKKGGRERGGG